VLVLVFGAAVAATVPLGLAIISIVAAVGAAALVGRALDLSVFIMNIIVMIGLAIGIDYSLLIIQRFREERRGGLGKADAVARAGATAGRTVLFSGMTVVIALLGMLIFPDPLFRSLGIGAILAAVFGVLAALTLLPAILSLLGDRVDRLAIPFLRRTPHASEGGGFWTRSASIVMRRPVISVVATVAVLLAAAAPFVTIDVGHAGVSTLPEDTDAYRAFAILDEHFSAGLMAPTQIVIDTADVNAPEVDSSTQRLLATLATDDAFGAATIETNEAGDLALVSVPVAGDWSSDEATAAVKRLRNDYIPEAFAGVDAEVLVSGETAQEIYHNDVVADYTPVVIAFVLGFSFLLLLVVFRSIVVPLKAVVMNLLSVGAAYGLLVLVFQRGVGAELLGFQETDTIETWVPLFLFCILFGLSMDYHVFLLSRIRERFGQTGDNTESVAFGIRSTGAIITGAALIMVAVFSAFAAGDLVMFQQMGFGLAVAVILDATIIRSVLVPAAMQLLGDLNWYLPSWLSWLPEIQVEDSRTS
jgi:RND superfamily putative drug exporter